MRSDEVFELLVKIENDVDVNELKWDSIKLWPLLRQTLYVELLNENRPLKMPDTHPLTSILKRIVSKPGTYSRKFLRVVRESFRRDLVNKNVEERAFISRQVYLQQLPSGDYFDRIIDPLVSLSENKHLTGKYYLDIPDTQNLKFSAEYLRPIVTIGNPKLSTLHMDTIRQVAELSGLDDSYLSSRFQIAFNSFTRWYRTAEKFLHARQALKDIFVTSWYFPDVMGICAAARERGVRVIDVQHGKQGRYQAMYSGWTKIPEQGYELMPDYFWCWGQPSCDHILSDSSKRKIHRPFVGGYPWLDYYKSFVTQSLNREDRELPADGILHVLVTTQPPQGSNREPIPDFLIQFLGSANPDVIKFIFRCHPNDRGGVSYCNQRLEALPKSLYIIDDGKDNLYDKLLESTHHVTAYSSCCYEAEALGVPTLLFGADAKNIYADEIESGRFVWTSGKLEDFVNWIDRFSSTGTGEDSHINPYIVSSLSHASRILISNDYA
jgi:hypothetical protein